MLIGFLLFPLVYINSKNIEIREHIVELEKEKKKELGGLYEFEFKAFRLSCKHMEALVIDGKKGGNLLTNIHNSGYFYPVCFVSDNKDMGIAAGKRQKEMGK